MQTFYFWGADNVYAGSREVDEIGEIPERCTAQEAPVIEGRCTIWNGQGWEVVSAVPEAPIDDKRQALVATNNAAYTAAIDQMTSDYPATEVSTWERQRAEVVAWDEDNTTATPWIDIASAARGVDREEYLRRTLAKVKAFARASAFYTGRRQGIDDKIRAATKASQLDQIVIDYSLPEA